MDHDTEFRLLLDDISGCFTARRFDDWRAGLLVPFSMITKDGPVVLCTEAQLRRNSELYLYACEAMKLDEVFRRPISLEPCPDGTWIGTYETHLLSHGHRATDPYICSALLHVVVDSFRISSILNARGHTSWTGIAPDPVTGGDTEVSG